MWELILTVHNDGPHLAPIQTVHTHETFLNYTGAPHWFTPIWMDPRVESSSLI